MAALIGGNVNAVKNDDGSWSLFVGGDGIATLRTDALDVNGAADFGSDITLSDTVWDDIRVPLTQGKPGASNPPGFAKIEDNGASSTGVFGYLFDKDAEEEVFFTVQIPHGYKKGTDLEPHVHWSAISSTTTSVVWGLEYSAAPLNGAFGETSILTVSDAAGGVTLAHLLASFTEIDGTSLGESSIIVCRVFRDATNDGDTMTADAVLHEIDFHYQVDKIGSDDEIPS